MPYKSTRELPKQVQSLPEATAGLNATGESDIRNYYDRIKSDQETRLQPALALLDEAIIRSTFGTRDPDIFYKWAPHCGR
jgi:uncharacterized protein